jgi:hypothetical protein
VVVEEVMQAPDVTTAAGGGLFSCPQQQQQQQVQLVAEMQEVDRQWLSRKGKHAGAWGFGWYAAIAACAVGYAVRLVCTIGAWP